MKFVEEVTNNRLDKILSIANTKLEQTAEELETLRYVTHIQQNINLLFYFRDTNPFRKYVKTVLNDTRSARYKGISTPNKYFIISLCIDLKQDIKSAYPQLDLFSRIGGKGNKVSIKYQHFYYDLM